MIEGMKFKQTIIDWARLKVALRRFSASLRLDITNDFLRPMMPELLLRYREQNRFVEATPRRRESLSRPEIYVSYATDESLKGSHKYCGGEKVLNNLVLLLRRHGYEAFMVTLDGRRIFSDNFSMSATGTLTLPVAFAIASVILTRGSMGKNSSESLRR